MGKKKFTEEQIKTLLQNPNIIKCSEKSISYSKEFKINAIKQYYQGLTPREIFKQAQFNLKLIGFETPKSCLKDWRKIFKNHGNQGLLIENRGKIKSKGRTKIKWENDKEKIKYLEAEVAYLKAENNFLAKLRKKS